MNLEDCSITVCKESVGKIHNLLLRHLRNSVQVTYLTFPLYAIDKGIHKLISTPAVVLHRTLVAQLLIVHYRWQQIVREVTLLQVLNLSQHQFAHLLQRLVWLWLSHQYECRVVLLVLQSTTSTLHLHSLVQVQVKETSFAVVQHITYHVQSVALQVSGLIG